MNWQKYLGNMNKIKKYFKTIQGKGRITIADLRWSRAMNPLSSLISDHIPPSVPCPDCFHFLEYTHYICCAHVVTVALNAFPHILPVETLLLSHFTLHVYARTDLSPTCVVTCICVFLSHHTLESLEGRIVLLFSFISHALIRVQYIFYAINGIEFTTKKKRNSSKIILRVEG